MAHYLVKAKPLRNLSALRARIDSGEISQMQPFGTELQNALLNARVDDAGWATWEEQCFCSPPLAEERAVLDQYFAELSTQTLRKGEGWSKISELPSLWK